MRKIFVATAVGAARGAAPALAQQPPLPEQVPAAGDVQPLTEAQDPTALVGLPVETSDGADIGQVAQIQADGTFLVSGGTLPGPISVPTALLGLAEGGEVVVLLLTESELRSQLPN